MAYPFGPAYPWEEWIRIFNSNGELAVAGVTNRIAISISVTPTGENTLKLSGHTAVKMTDFGISRPEWKGTNFTVTVGDEVEITFEWILVRATTR